MSGVRSEIFPGGATADSTRPGVLADARAIAAADPAGQGTAATLLSCPGLHAVAARRVAHRLGSTRWGKPAAQAIAAGAVVIPDAPLRHRGGGPPGLTPGPGHPGGGHHRHQQVLIRTPVSGSTMGPWNLSSSHLPVRQLRVVVEADDYDAALAFFRDALGLPESASFAEGPEDRMAILEAGRAILEIANPAHKTVIDRIEADGRPSPAIRLTFEVDDAHATTDRLQHTGGDVIAAPVRTPGHSLNSRLTAPAGLQITRFQEMLPAQERTARPGFDTAH